MYITQTGRDIEKAAAFLKNNEVVAIPTETVYGLAANALEKSAVLKIFEVKKRPLFNPLIVHIKNIEAIYDYAKEIPDLALKLFEKFSPGPLTVILPKKSLIPDVTTATKNNVALRIPNHPITLELLKLLDFPLAAPSANPFGYISPTSAQHVLNQLDTKIPYILNGGPCESGLESTVVSFIDGKAVLNRLGAISFEELKTVIPNISLKNKDSDSPIAPGMLKQHYSPNTKMILCDNLENVIKNNISKNIGIISLSDFIPSVSPEKMIILSQKGDLEEAASKLYAAMHYLDNLNLDCIIIEKMPARGLGLAMNDRLERAAAKFL